MFMRRSRAGPAAVHPVPIVPHLPGTCIAPRRAGPDAAFPASCRALRCDEAEKRRLLKQALGRTAAPKRPAAAKGPAKHNIRLRQVSGGNAGAGGAQQGKTHACNRQAALCLAVPACPFACACGAKAPCRMFSCTARLAACTAAGAPPVQPVLCRALVCIRRAGILYQKIRAKPTDFSREWVQSCAPKIYLTHSVRRGTLEIMIFYIFWEDLS